MKCSRIFYYIPECPVGFFTPRVSIFSNSFTVGVSSVNVCKTFFFFLKYY